MQATVEEKKLNDLLCRVMNLIVLYCVDPETNAYREYSASTEYEGLGIPGQGDDFFEAVFEDSLRKIHPEDRSLFHSQITKENILAAIEQSGEFAMACRLLQGDRPRYVRLRAAKIEENGKAMLIIGLMDEDTQIRQEQEYARDLSAARKMAVIDSLTGVKNKHAYVEWEEKINEKIAQGEQEPFAVVLCDINNLKAVNDLHGHKQGDVCIKKACAKICGIFSHSPVFRIGGDEFVVLLTGSDYDRRANLLERVNAIPADTSQIRVGDTISAGMVEYRTGQHASLSAVVDDADKAMYERKQFLKETLLSEESPSDSDSDPEYMPEINLRKHILIADDIESNREMLGELLEEDYDIFYAADGIETMKILRAHKDEIALLILDLYMPNMTGQEVMAQMQVDVDLMSVPVVVLTVDQAAELECLKLGAMDFIPKPYPNIEIVKARISKCIELSENRDLIRRTERDKLTGLFHPDYFLRYVNRYDQYYGGKAFDAVVCDINRFYSVNELYGRQFGDRVLRSIGTSLKKLARRTGGLVCRRGGDNFLLYCPHQENYEQLFQDFLEEVFAAKDAAGKVTMRFGVYANAQEKPDIEERFIRAQIAADSIGNDPQKICGYYEF